MKLHDQIIFELTKFLMLGAAICFIAGLPLLIMGDDTIFLCGMTMAFISWLSAERLCNIYDKPRDAKGRFTKRKIKI